MTGTYRPRRLWRQIGGDDDSHGHEVLKAVVVVAVDLWVALVLVTCGKSDPAFVLPLHEGLSWCQSIFCNTAQA